MRVEAQGAEALAIAERLADPVRLKTWSLIVTVFGDAILPRGGSISAHSLGVILGAMGIGSGAVRTAVSRLAADGWIERRREGRMSFYRLAPARQAEFRAAERRIYQSAPPDSGTGNWAIVCLPRESAGEGIAGPGPGNGAMMEIVRGWYLADLDGLAAARDDMMVFRGRFETCPPWFVEMVAPRDQSEAMERLIALFEPLGRRLASGWQPQSLDALALRCLLVHEWRRIVLRLNRLPRELLPQDWPEIQCRELVGNVYARLAPLSEEWLSLEASCATGSLPPPMQDPARRFARQDFHDH